MKRNDQWIETVNRKLNCPKCSKPMVEGFTLDHGHSQNVVSTWVAGPPERSIWVGLKTGKRDNIPIRTFRCSGCGYLESYADRADAV